MFAPNKEQSSGPEEESMLEKYKSWYLDSQCPSKEECITVEEFLNLTPEQQEVLTSPRVKSLFSFSRISFKRILTLSLKEANILTKNGSFNGILARAISVEEALKLNPQQRGCLRKSAIHYALRQGIISLQELGQGIKINSNDELEIEIDRLVEIESHSISLRTLLNASAEAIGALGDIEMNLLQKNRVTLTEVISTLSETVAREHLSRICGGEDSFAIKLINEGIAGETITFHQLLTMPEGKYSRLEALSYGRVPVIFLEDGTAGHDFTLEDLLTMPEIQLIKRLKALSYSENPARRLLEDGIAGHKFTLEEFLTIPEAQFNCLRCTPNEVTKLITEGIADYSFTLEKLLTMSSDQFDLLRRHPDELTKLITEGVAGRKFTLEELLSMPRDQFYLLILSSDKLTKLITEGIAGRKFTLEELLTMPEDQYERLKTKAVKLILTSNISDHKFELKELLDMPEEQYKRLEYLFYRTSKAIELISEGIAGYKCSQHKN